MTSANKITTEELQNGHEDSDPKKADDKEIMVDKTNKNDEYFKSYNDISVHELMLKDRPRTLAYRKFFKENSEKLRGKIVLDIGAGTGILSLFAASVGAGKVYAVEASDVANLCRQIVVANGLESKIEVIQGRIEDDVLPRGTEVDVIVSEWMGFYLFHESMLDSVIFARDRYLKSDGMMVPSHASLKIVPASLEKYCSEHIDYWQNVYGFDFSPVVSVAMATARRQPVITEVNCDEVLSDSQEICCIDLKSVLLKDVQKMSSNLTFTLNKSSELQGFACWFDVLFQPFSSQEGITLTDSASANGVASPVVLSTSPSSPATHWKQTAFLLPQTVCADKGDNITIQVELSQDEGNKRHYNISIEVEGSDEVDADYSEEEDAEEHAVPCDCGAPRCRLIKAVMEKYDTEHRELEAEAELVDVAAGVVACHQLDSEMISEGNDESFKTNDDESFKINDDQ